MVKPPCLNLESDFSNFFKMSKIFKKITGTAIFLNQQVALLNANTRLNINLFLSRLDSGAEDLVQNLEEGNISQLSLPMLQYLIKLMPCPEEV